MDRIEKYIRELTRRLRAGREAADTDELREEVRGHLRETVDELRREGRSEQESVAIALERFGDGKRLNAELHGVWKSGGGYASKQGDERSRDRDASRLAKLRDGRPSNRRLAKLLAAAALSLFVLSLLGVLAGVAMERRNVADFDGMQQSVRDRLESRLDEGKPIAEADMSAFYRENRRVLRFVQLVHTDGEGRTIASSVYPAGTEQDQLRVQPYYIRPLGPIEDNQVMELTIGLDRDEVFSPIPPLLLKGAAGCFALYWLAYALWGMTAAKRTGRLNAGWAILFLTLNVVGYLLFRLTGKMGTDRLLAAL